MALNRASATDITFPLEANARTSDCTGNMSQELKNLLT